MNKNSLYIIWLFLLIIGGLKAQTITTVTSQEELRRALDTSGSVEIHLANTIELGDNTLSITQGSIILDLKGNTLSATRGSNGRSICLSIKGGSLILKGGGKVSAKAKGTTAGTWGSGKNGYDAVAISYDSGFLEIWDAEFEAIATKGAGIISGSDGIAYTIDTNNGAKVKGTIPYGAYIVGKSLSDYEAKNIVASSTTVSLSEYTAKYNANGATDHNPSDMSYTIDDIFTYPTVSRIGYKFIEWAPNESFQLVNNVPVLTDHAAKGEITFTAQWEAIKYKITYQGDESSLPADAKKEYIITDETYILPPLKRTSYRFLGWYEGNIRVSEIAKGSYRDYNLTAKWVPEYQITYSYDNSNASPVSTLLEKYIDDELPYQLPDLKVSTAEYAFAGWYTESEYKNKITRIEKGTNKNLMLYGKLSKSYKINLNWNIGASDSQLLYYSTELGQVLPTKGKTKNGYSFAGWYVQEDLSGERYTQVGVGESGDKTFYAKWTPVQYKLSYDYLYNGILPVNATKEYNIETRVLLPMPTRQGYSFVGWHIVDESEDWSESGHGVIPFAFNEQKAETGNKTFYAEWKGGYILTIQQAEGGLITVKNKANNQKVESGIAIDKGTNLEISATAASSIYQFRELLINGKPFASTPQTVTMPDTCGLTISAVFVDGRPAVSKPEVSTDPQNTDFIPVGGSVKVTMKNTDKEAVLYYTVDGSNEKLYTQPFMISGTSAKTMEVKAIARKEGYRDGVTTRQITFGTGKIVITFDLPEGITAVNPDGGEVVSAVATGGTFEFILDVDESVIPSTSQMKVLLNDTLRIYPDASGVYTLEKQKTNAKIRVAGVVQKDVVVTLTQTKNGQIVFADDETTATRKVNYGDTITVKAIPNVGCYFTKWMDGNTDILRQIIVKKDWNLSAVFSANKYVYKVVFPQIQGVTVKTLSAYSNEVEDGGTCKFYLRLAEEYDQSAPVVYANGEKLEPIKDVYSLYYIHIHYSIAVEGIRRNKEMYALPEHVTGLNLETGKSLTDEATLPEAQVMIYANALDGQAFDKWNDGSKENPRITRASSASHLLPIWKKASEGIHKVDFMLSAGAGVAAVNAGNASAVLKGENFQFKVVLLPQYSQSPVIVKAGDKVLQPVMELRAATELTTRYYTLENLSADTKVEITGLMLNKYKPLVEQTKGGKVSVSTSDSVAYGTDITLKATADPGYIFLKWSDGNTLNPYPYKVEDNSSVSAVFIGKGLTVDNESIQKEENAQITVSGQTLSVTVAKESMLYIWDYKGSLFRNLKISAGAYTLNLPAGGYLVKVGDMGARKIIIR